MTSITKNMGMKEWWLLIGLSLLWGGSFFFVEVAIGQMPTLVIVLMRVLLAAVALWLIVWLRHITLPRSPKLWGSFLVMGLLNNVIPFSLIVWGQAHITSGLASILNATTPLFTVILASLLLSDEKMTSHKLIGVIIGFAGTAVMLGPAALEGIGVDILAQMAILGAAISYGFAAIFGRRFRAFALHPILIAASQLTGSTLLLLPAVLYFHPLTHFTLPTLNSLLALVSLAMFSTALAYIIYFRILSSSGASNLALVTFLIPISAILLGVFILGERLQVEQIMGMLIITLGLMVMDGRVLQYFKK